MEDLAELYGVETKAVKQAVKRNLDISPEHFMSTLSEEEDISLRSQFVTLKKGKHSKYPPYAFTEYGVLMLASVLRSEKADIINILIIDTFVAINTMLLTHKDLLLQMEEIRKKVTGQDEKIKRIFNYLKQFIKEKASPRNKIGFMQREAKME